MYVIVLGEMKLEYSNKGCLDAYKYGTTET